MIKQYSNIFISKGEEDFYEIRSLFKAADYYITNRARETVLYSCYADEFSVKIISGVDSIIFP